MVGSCSNNVVKLVDLHNSQAQSSINFVIILGQHNHQLPMIIPRKGDKARCACQKLGGDKQRKKQMVGKTPGRTAEKNEAAMGVEEPLKSRSRDGARQS